MTRTPKPRPWWPPSEGMTVNARTACKLLRGQGAGEEEGGSVRPGAGRGDEHPAFVLLGLVLVGDEGEAQHVREPGDRLVIIADDEGDVGEVRHPEIQSLKFFNGHAKLHQIAPYRRQ